MQAEFLSTRDVPRLRQLDCWNQWAASNWNGISVSSRGLGFPAELTKFQAGNTRFSRVISHASAVRRQPGQQDGKRLILHYQQAGATSNRQCGRESVLAPGDLTLLRLDEGYDLDTSNELDLLIAEFDEQALRDRLGVPAVRSAIRLDAQAPGVALIGQMLAGLCGGAQVPVDGQAEYLIERSFLDMLALAVMSSERMMAGRGSGTLFRRAVAEIERARDDAALSPPLLAERLGISQRALQLAFAETGTTPSAYLMERRLDLAAQRLGCESASITEIALDCGFASSAHFSRCFSQRFGVSPRGYRRARP